MKCSYQSFLSSSIRTSLRIVASAALIGFAGGGSAFAAGPSNHGSCVSEVARDTPPGEDHGAAVTAAAHACDTVETILEPGDKDNPNGEGKENRPVTPATPAIPAVPGRGDG